MNPRFGGAGTASIPNLRLWITPIDPELLFFCNFSDVAYHSPTWISTTCRNPQHTSVVAGILNHSPAENEDSDSSIREELHEEIHEVPERFGRKRNSPMGPNLRHSLDIQSVDKESLNVVSAKRAYTVVVDGHLGWCNIIIYQFF